MGAGPHIRVPHSSTPPPPAHAGATGSPAPTGAGRGRDLLVQLVSGLRGPAWRDAEIERLEADGWRRASEPCAMYGSVWVEKEVDE